MFKCLLNSLNKQFNFIIVDTPPSISGFTDNVCLTNDDIIIVMLAQKWGFDDAVAYIK